MDRFENIFKKIFLVLILSSLLIFSAFKVQAQEGKHLPQFNPYWYPSDAIYGFVKGCWEKMENTQSLNEFWPAELQSICGCILDNIRIMITWNQFVSEWVGTLKGEKAQIAASYTNMCVQRAFQIKQLQKEMKKNESGD